MQRHGVESLASSRLVCRVSARSFSPNNFFWTLICHIGDPDVICDLVLLLLCAPANSYYSAKPDVGSHIMAEQLERAPELSLSAAVVSLPPASVSTVTVKIPPFWPVDPQVWFAQVEAQFSMQNTTSQRTKFDHVVAALAPEFATEVRELLLQPPADTPYNVLRTQLIKRTAASKQHCLRKLFTAEELGDGTPSQLLQRLQQLLGDAAGPNPDNTFFRELFLQRLPGHGRMQRSL